MPLVVTVEEGTLEGGFGSAVLEAANAAGLDTRNVVRLGMPDRFIEHGERNELLADWASRPTSWPRRSARSGARKWRNRGLETGDKTRYSQKPRIRIRGFFACLLIVP